MRSIRTAILLAVVALVAVAFAAPAGASASEWTQSGSPLTGGIAWTQNGASLIGSGGSFTASGTIRSQSAAAGTIECPVNSTVSVKGNSSAATMSGLPTAGATCTMTGAINSTCTPGKLRVEPIQNWNINAAQSAGNSSIQFSEELFIVLDVQGGPCESWYLLLEGKPTFVPDSASGINTLTMSGSMKLWTLIGKEKYSWGSTTMAGTLNVSPAGTYGFSSNRLAKITGTFGWASAVDGGLSCPVSGSVVMEAGTDQGKLVSLTKGSGSCESFGAYKIGCGVPTGMSGSEWSLKDEGTAIKATGVSITTSGSCPETYTGELTLNVDKTSAISSSSFSGVLSSGSLKRTWTGSMSWTPAGVFGL